MSRSLGESVFLFRSLKKKVVETKKGSRRVADFLLSFFRPRSASIKEKPNKTKPTSGITVDASAKEIKSSDQVKSPRPGSTSGVASTPARATTTNPVFRPTDVNARPSNPTGSIASTSTMGSTGPAKKVMDWFRKKSLAKSTFNDHRAVSPGKTDSFVSVNHPGDTPPRPIRSATGVPAVTTNEDPATSSTETIPQPPPAVVVTGAGGSPPPTSTLTKSTAPSSFKALNPPAPLRSAREVADSIAMPPPALPTSSSTNNVVSSFKENSLRVHQGIVDKKAMTGSSPPLVFAQVIKVLQEMGIEIKKDGDFKLKCVRARRKSSAGSGGGGATVGLGLSSSASVPTGSAMSGFSMIGFASSSSVSFKRFRCLTSSERELTFRVFFLLCLLSSSLFLSPHHRPTNEGSLSQPLNPPPSSPPPNPS